MKKIIILLMISIFWIKSYSQTSYSCSDSVVLNTGYNHSTNAIYPTGSIDPNWQLVQMPVVGGTFPCPTVSLPSVSYVVSDLVSTVLSNSQAISFQTTNSLSCNNPSSDGNPIVFEKQFCMKSQDEIIISGVAHYDDMLCVFIDNIYVPITVARYKICSTCPFLSNVVLTTYSSCDPFKPMTNVNRFYGNHFTLTIPLMGGVHKVQLRLRNLGGVFCSVKMEGSIKSASGKTNNFECPDVCKNSIVSLKKLIDVNCDGEISSGDTTARGWNFVATMPDGSSKTITTDDYGYAYLNNLPASGLINFVETMGLGYNLTSVTGALNTGSNSFQLTLNNSGFYEIKVLNSKCNNPCKCGQWGSIGYIIGNKTDKFRCGNNTQLEAEQGDFFQLRQRYVCLNDKGDSCGNGNIKYNIYYPNGGKLLNQTSLDKFKLDSCGVNRIVMIPTCGGVECQPCEFSIKVNCCKCASTFKAALFWTTGSGNSILDNQLDLKCGETYTNKLKCFQQYTINIENPCGYNCIPDSVIVTILQPNNILIFGKSFTPNQVGTYSVTIKIKCNGKWCPPCIIKFVQTQKCELPCNNCTQNVQFDFDANSSTAIENIYPKPTTLNTYFTLFGGTDTYTQVRVNVVDFQITSDNPACLACYTSAGQWASIIDGDLPGFTSVISTYPGVAVANPNNNSREIIFNTNSPSLIPMPTTLNLGFQIPGANPLACCCIDVTLYLKVTYRNNKCEECTNIIKVAFKQCNGKKGKYEDGGQPHFRMHTPNNDDLKQINTNASSATKNE